MRIQVTSPQSHTVLRRLRPPCARSVYLVYPFAPEGAVNQGWTLRFPTGEPAVAPGDGIVVDVRLSFPVWSYTRPSEHQSKQSYEVVINHGTEVYTVVAGLSSVDVFRGATVRRGDKLGASLTNEVFFGVQYLRRFYDPDSISSYFAVQNEREVTGQGRKIRFAPDKLLRDLSNNIVVTIADAVGYFTDALRRTPRLLINVDFNGDGTKFGLAATGFGPDDLWNVYAPLDYSDPPYYCVDVDDPPNPPVCCEELGIACLKIDGYVDGSTLGDCVAGLGSAQPPWNGHIPYIGNCVWGFNFGINSINSRDASVIVSLAVCDPARIYQMSIIERTAEGGPLILWQGTALGTPLNPFTRTTGCSPPTLTLVNC